MVRRGMARFEQLWLRWHGPLGLAWRQQALEFRAASCTGACYHVDLYVVTGDIEDLPAGVYHYGAHNDTLVPLRLYIKNGVAKVELGLAKGKRRYDKRQAIKERETRREMEAAIKRRVGRGPGRSEG